MEWWLLCFTVITGSLLVVFLIFAFTGVVVFPAWAIELHFTFYWFSFVFRDLSLTYLSMTEKKTYMHGRKAFVGNLFTIQLVTAYALRFGLPNEYLLSHPLLAYPLSYLLLARIPLNLFYFLYPLWMRHQSQDRLEDQEIVSIANEAAVVTDFQKRFHPVHSFIYNQSRMHDEAHFVLMHRFPRNEMEDLMEDVLLEFNINMRHRKIVENSIHYSRYIFTTDNEQSRVMHLEEGPTIEHLTRNPPLDQETLQKFEALFSRFPSLTDYPLPVMLLADQVKRLE